MMTIETAAGKALTIAEIIRDYWETELPKRHPKYPFVGPGADDGPPPPEEKKLRQFLTRLKGDTLYKLALVMYLGRGDIDKHELQSKYKEIREDFSTATRLISFMMDKASLADYLERGMEILRNENIDLNKMDLKTREA
jgi:hypothetical protein